MHDNNRLLLQTTIMNIQEKIRSLRQSKGYTQDYMAHKLDIDTVNYGRIERAQAKLTVERLIKICDILSISPALLFSEKESSPAENASLLKQIHCEIQSINNKLKTIL
jgi:transcriptional regulator with XRE-family HTH domain